MAISRDLKIDVSGKSAKFSKEIFLYRSDKNIDLLIEIVDTEYKYDRVTRGNILRMIEGDGDIVAELKIVKPAGEEISVHDVPVRNGRVKFTITEDLCDSLDEVGIHKLQILLKDGLGAQKHIPPVSFEIGEPLFISGATNAMVDKSRVGKARVAKNKYKIGVRANGDYVATDWATGDLITADLLNHLETKVEELDTSIVKKAPIDHSHNSSDILTQDQETNLNKVPELQSEVTEVKSQLETIENSLKDIYVDDMVLNMNDATSVIQEIINNNNNCNIILPSGTIYITQLKVKSYMKIVGSGNTILKQVANSLNKDIIVAGFNVVQMFGVENVKIDGNKLRQTTNNKGICINISKNAGDFYKESIFKDVDAKHLYKNVSIYDVKGNAFEYSGRGESHFENILINRCDENGFVLNSFDNWINNVSVGESGISGFVCNLSNNRYCNCKSWMNGRIDQSSGYGFNILNTSASTSFVCCEAQDNANHGFFIDAQSVNVSGCVADSNGWNYWDSIVFEDVSGFYLTDKATGCSITGIADDRYVTDEGVGYKQSYGVFISSLCKSNTINICVNRTGKSDSKIMAKDPLYMNSYNIISKINGKSKLTSDYFFQRQYFGKACDSNDKYMKFASITHTKRWGVDPFFKLLYVTSTGISGSIIYTSKQDSNMGEKPIVSFLNKQYTCKDLGGKITNNNNFIAVITSCEADKSVIELYYKGKINERFNFVPECFSDFYNDSIINFPDETNWVDILPPGEVFTASTPECEVVTGTVAPSKSASFIGQDFIDISNKKIYKSVSVGNGASDWVCLN